MSHTYGKKVDDAEIVDALAGKLEKTSNTYMEKVDHADAIDKLYGKAPAKSYNFLPYTKKSHNVEQEGLTLSDKAYESKVEEADVIDALNGTNLKHLDSNSYEKKMETANIMDALSGRTLLKSQEKLDSKEEKTDRSNHIEQFSTKQ